MKRNTHGRLWSHASVSPGSHVYCKSLKEKDSPPRPATTQWKMLTYPSTSALYSPSSFPSRTQSLGSFPDSVVGRMVS